MFISDKELWERCQVHRGETRTYGFREENVKDEKPFYCCDRQLSVAGIKRRDPEELMEEGVVVVLSDKGFLSWWENTASSHRPGDGRERLERL